MDELFWKIVDVGAVPPYYLYDSQTRRLRVDRMKKFIGDSNLSDGEVIGIYQLALKAIDMLYNPELHGACKLYWGGMSDDSFTDHRRWIVSLGIEQYNLAMQDPDTFYSSFVDIKPHPVSPFFEAFIRSFKDEVENRSLENKVKITWPRGGALDEIPSELLRQRFPKIAGKLEQHQCSDFDSLSEAADKTKTLLDSGELQ